MSHRRKWFIVPAMIILALSLSGISFAQEKEFEEVVVTAQKKEQGIREVPVSVATISDEKLDAITAAGNDIRLLSSRVPSLVIESSYGRTLPRFYIRGLGNTDFDLNASQPVSLVYDGVVLENPILKGYPMFDLERVEVLRGPQGTLFGRNTPAGIVKFESRKPKYENNGFGRFSFGTYQTMQFESAVNGIVMEDKMAARASFLYQGRNDWVKNTANTAPPADGNDLGGYKDFAGRVQFLYTPGDRFSALANVHMRDLDGTARLFRADIVESGSNEIVDGFKRDEVTLDGANQQRVEEYGGVLKLEYEFDEAVLTAITGYEDGKIYSRGDIDGGTTYVFPPDGFRFPAESADGIPKLNQFTQEIRYATRKGPGLNYLVGFFYFNEDLEIESYNFDTLTPGRPVNGFASQAQQTSAWAAFAAVDYDFSETFKGSVGLRYSDDDKDFTAGRTLSPIGAGALAETTLNAGADFLSWDVNGLYRLNEDHNLYGRIASSFRAPSFQGRLLFGDDISQADTEKIISYELGLKSNFSQKVRGNVSLFYYDMSDQQLTAVGGEANFNRLYNAEKTNGYGLEAEFEFIPSSQIQFTLGGSYNKTEIKDENLGVAPGGAVGITVLDPELSPGIVSINGNSLPNAPEAVLVATLRGALPAGESGEVFLYTDWNYKSSVNFFLYESVEFQQDGVVEGGLRIGYATFDRGFEVAGFVRNITDELYRNGGIDFNNLTGFVNEPRTFGMEIRRAF